MGLGEIRLGEMGLGEMGLGEMGQNRSVLPDVLLMTDDKLLTSNAMTTDHNQQHSRTKFDYTPSG